MMSKTHLTLGIATALAFVENGNIPMIITAIAGGALGGVEADIDILDNDNTHDAIAGQILAISITGIMLLIDKIFKLGILTQIISNGTIAIIGAVIYTIICIYGFGSTHRGFTHSIIAMILFSFAIGMIYDKVTMFYAVAYVSHLILDLLNKRGIQLFFPFKYRPCFKLCYANKEENKYLMYTGLVFTVILTIFKLIKF